MTNDTKRVDELEIGDRILYPHAQRNSAPVDRPVTITGVVEYEVNRVLYFAEGGFGIVDRRREPLELVAQEI